MNARPPNALSGTIAFMPPRNNQSDQKKRPHAARAGVGSVRFERRL